VNASWLRWALGAAGEIQPLELARCTPGMLRAFLPHAIRRPLTFALTARLALTASLADEAAALVARGLPLLFVWGDDDQLIAPGALGDIAAELPAEVVHGRHGWLLTFPEEFATLLRNALVVHAMLERKQRGLERAHGALALPPGMSLADFIPHERRSITRSR
jgi:pimeloyl-ACP methyl ester carboxylesterase